MRIETISQTGTGQSDSYNVTQHDAVEFNIGFGAVVTGTATYTVQHTYDGTNWFDHPTVAGSTANDDGSYQFPVVSIRVNVTAGTGTVDLTIVSQG